MDIMPSHKIPRIVISKIYNEAKLKGTSSELLRIEDKDFRNVSLDSDFEKAEPHKLGKGGFGDVTCWKHRRTGKIMAIKKMASQEQGDRPARPSSAARDVGVLNRLESHSNIITVYGSFTQCGQLYLCMEKMECCLRRIIAQCRVMDTLVPVKLIAAVCHSVASALCFLKKNDVIHRDIKPGNILIDKYGIIKISDFGGSGYLSGSFALSNPIMTHCYAAPERIDHKDGKRFTCAADVWSLGITAVELATLYNPYEGLEKFEMMTNVVEHAPPQLLPSNKGYEIELSAFIEGCLKNKPEERLYLKRKRDRLYIMDHTFINRDSIMTKGGVSDWCEMLLKGTLEKDKLLSGR